MKRVLITGTNGMIGRLILERCLQRTDVATVTSITRKPLGIAHPKLREVIHHDFMDLSSIRDHFSNQDLCFYCIGVYTGTVPREEFRKITADYTRVFAETLKQMSPEVVFCFLSGQGADRTEKSKLMFAQDKGIAENILEKLAFKQLIIVRPGYIYPVTPRKEPNFFYRLSRLLYKPVLSKIYPNIGLTSLQLANAMVKLGWQGASQQVYENKEIRQVAISE
ncbi:MAG: NAD-dependent epimerase/dehydratase family protein [Bacteroidetes bacterium]|nr:NAD-dependent epimerase/dehydratase family protein [Bacteroidota bacterium]